jgi:predicted TIM-barrel fold metal-dependent hydrolase
MSESETAGRPAQDVNMFRNIGTRKVEQITLLPDPQPSPRTFALISVDDHLVEPPDVFTDRLPARFKDDEPRVERGDDGVDRWVFTDTVFDLPMITVSVVGIAPEQWSLGPINFEDMRPGSWDIDSRIHDMDLAGIWASQAFPSGPFGFAGQRFMRMPDANLGNACMRAYNDWIAEVWAGRYPDRIIAQQITALRDVEVAVAEIERNAARGFQSVAFTENPERLGLPSLYTRYWDPFFAACQDTGTVVNLHVGSSSQTLSGSSDAPEEVSLSLFGLNAAIASVDWLYAGVPSRFPQLKICFAESGIGWVPMLLDRIERSYRNQNAATGSWKDPLPPQEVFKRNYWFTALEDPSTLQLRHRIGVDRIMYEVDYPHADTSWPDCFDIVQKDLEGIPSAEVSQIIRDNASQLYGQVGPSMEWLNGTMGPKT